MSRGARREGLSRRHRFRGPDCFRPLLRSPRKFTGILAVLHVSPAATHASRFGISIGRRTARHAVDRNRVKRLAREMFRRHPVKHSAVDLVITLTPRFDLSQAEALQREVGDLLERARARMSS